MPPDLRQKNEPTPLCAAVNRLLNRKQLLVDEGNPRRFLANHVDLRAPRGYHAESSARAYKLITVPRGYSLAFTDDLFNKLRTGLLLNLPARYHLTDDGTTLYELGHCGLLGVLLGRR